MKSYTIRDYRGKEDLERMQDLVSSNFSIKSDFHSGDIAWQRFQHENNDESWPTYLFEDQGKLVAWGWLENSSHLVLAVSPSYPEVTKLVVDKFSRITPANQLFIDIFESEKHIVSSLLENGFNEEENSPFHWRMFHDLENLNEVDLAEGFSARYIDVNSDFQKRVDVHREAWNPSRVTYKSYSNVMKTQTYCPKLDWVIEAPDGTFASYCLIWFDKKTKIGLLEPVGTSPRFRQMGLSKAVCTLALSELKKMGGKGAIVNSRGDAERPIPGKLYGSIGFERLCRTRTFIKKF